MNVEVQVFIYPLIKFNLSIVQLGLIRVMWRNIQIVRSNRIIRKKINIFYDCPLFGYCSPLERGRPDCAAVGVKRISAKHGV
jgi:hypothetical protein